MLSAAVIILLLGLGLFLSPYKNDIFDVIEIGGALFWKAPTEIREPVMIALIACGIVVLLVLGLDRLGMGSLQILTGVVREPDNPSGVGIDKALDVTRREVLDRRGRLRADPSVPFTRMIQVLDDTPMPVDETVVIVCTSGYNLVAHLKDLL
jgi:hypothetical protein